LIRAEKGNYPVARMADLLGVDRRRYYEWETAQAAGWTNKQWWWVPFVDEVVRLWDASDQTYGAPRIHADLIAEGWQVSQNTVAKAMRMAQIQGISPRSWHPATTNRGDDPTSAPDLVGRVFDQGNINIAWFSDITYVSYGRRWAYLCAVKDGNTRRVLGRTVADNMRADLVEQALRQAVTLRGQLPGKVIFHADRGSQYTSQQIADLAVELPILRSMGRTGVCWDNAMAESFWSTYKAEYYYRHVFATLDELQRGTYTWIDSWYNAKRRHSAIGYLSPLEYERRLLQQAQTN
jgi:transposase InsO family protein